MPMGDASATATQRGEAVAMAIKKTNGKPAFKKPDIEQKDKARL
jgi:hypothetical protein